MKSEFWIERWQEHKIGFHQSEYNARLIQHWPTKNSTPQKIFVPLCGKSLDLKFLAQFGRVTGVELSGIAIRSFFEEWACPTEVSALHGMPMTHANGVSLIEGDLFELPTELNGSFTHAYDRASMIALPPHMRAQYVEVLYNLLDVGGEVLLVTIQYPESELPGPPFSVGPEWVSINAGHRFMIEHIETIDTWRAESPLAQEGLTALDTHVFRLTKR